MRCLDKPFFFFSVPRPLALVLDFALALGIFVDDLVTLEVELNLVLVAVCVVLVLAMVQAEGRMSKSGWFMNSRIKSKRSVKERKKKVELKVR